MAKFKVGQEVIFDQGEAADILSYPREVKAIVDSIHMIYNDTPLYQISFLSGSGHATVTEKDLTAIETISKRKME